MIRACCNSEFIRGWVACKNDAMRAAMCTFVPLWTGPWELPFWGRETGLGSVESFPIFLGGTGSEVFWGIVYLCMNMHQNLPTF